MSLAGELVSNEPWFSLARQDDQTCLAELGRAVSASGRLSCSAQLSHELAFDGGSCVEFSAQTHSHSSASDASNSNRSGSNAEAKEICDLEVFRFDASARDEKLAIDSVTNAASAASGILLVSFVVRTESLSRSLNLALLLRCGDKDIVLDGADEGTIALQTQELAGWFVRCRSVADN